jgi:hypothetical protein
MMGRIKKTEMARAAKNVNRMSVCLIRKWGSVCFDLEAV